NVLAYSRWRASSQQPPYRSHTQSATKLLLKPMLRCGHILEPPVGGGDGRGADGRARGMGVGSTLPARFPLRRWMNGGSGSVENAVGGETAAGERTPGAEQADHGRKRSVHRASLDAVRSLRSDGFASP